MINAELKPTDNRLEMRYSNPKGEFTNSAFFPVTSEQEAMRMLHFKNRKYIIETLTRWLNQRNYALNYSDPKGIKLLNFLQYIEKASFDYIRISIGKLRADFESIQPPSTSRFHKHYTTTILPILDYCTLKS